MQMAIGGFDLVSYSLKSLFYMVVFSLAMENTKEEDKKSLEQDAGFKKVLAEANAQFKNHYNAFHKQMTHYLSVSYGSYYIRNILQRWILDLSL